MIAQKRKIYLIGISFFVLVLLLLLGLISPLFSTIKKDSLELLSQKEKLISLDKKRDAFRDLQETYSQVQANLDKINSLFIDVKEPIDFINFLENTAEKLNLSIQISLTAKESEKKGLPELSFQIKTNGTFTNFMKFLEKLESTSYLIKIEKLTIKKISETSPSFELKKSQKIEQVQSVLDIRVLAK